MSILPFVFILIIICFVLLMIKIFPKKQEKVKIVLENFSNFDRTIEKNKKALEKIIDHYLSLKFDPGNQREIVFELNSFYASGDYVIQVYYHKHHDIIDQEQLQTIIKHYRDKSHLADRLHIFKITGRPVMIVYLLEIISPEKSFYKIVTPHYFAAGPI